MSTTFIGITAIQPPIDMGPDASNRASFSLNFTYTTRSPTADISLAVVELLGALAVYGTDTFVGRTVPIPTGNGPYTTIIRTGGSAHTRTHGDDEVLENGTFQVYVRATNPLTAEQHAIAVMNKLDGTFGITTTN